jgi:hypothetical protein
MTQVGRRPQKKWKKTSKKIFKKWRWPPKIKIEIEDNLKKNEKKWRRPQKKLNSKIKKQKDLNKNKNEDKKWRQPQKKPKKSKINKNEENLNKNEKSEDNLKQKQNDLKIK